MTSLTMSQSIWGGFGALFTDLTKTDAHRSSAERSPEYRRAERDCINEMIWSNPDAFSGELDVQHVMYGVRGRR